MINRTIIQFLCVDCMVHHWLLLYVVCFVRVCDHPLLLPQSLKSGEDQPDNMKCSGMEETGNNQVQLLQINCNFLLGRDGLGAKSQYQPNCVCLLRASSVFSNLEPIFP